MPAQAVHATTHERQRPRRAAPGHARLNRCGTHPPAILEPAAAACNPLTAARAWSLDPTLRIVKHPLCRKRTSASADHGAGGLAGGGMWPSGKAGGHIDVM